MALGEGRLFFPNRRVICVPVPSLPWDLLLLYPNQWYGFCILWDGGVTIGRHLGRPGW